MRCINWWWVWWINDANDAIVARIFLWMFAVRSGNTLGMFLEGWCYKVEMIDYHEEWYGWWETIDDND